MGALSPCPPPGAENNVTYGCLYSYSTKQDYLDAVDRIVYHGGNTNTTGGLLVARDQILSQKGGDRPDIMDLVLLITDGKELVCHATLPN